MKFYKNGFMLNFLFIIFIFFNVSNIFANEFKSAPIMKNKKKVEFKCKSKLKCKSAPIKISKKYSFDFNNSDLNYDLKLKKELKNKINYIKVLNDLEKNLHYKLLAYINKNSKNEEIKELYDKLKDCENKILIKQNLIKFSLGLVLADSSDKALKEIQKKSVKLAKLIEIYSDPVIKMENSISEYFSRKFNIIDEKNIKQTEKQGGTQLGRIVDITMKNNITIRYYVKTHSLGSNKNCKSSKSAESLSVKELFIYKMLYKFDIAPEPFFFGGDDKNYYIATRDAGYNNNEKSDFKTYEKIQNDVRKILNKNKKTKINEKLVLESTISEKILSNHKNLINGFVLSDIISRIYNLSDLIENSGNFGIVTESGEFKIIDFRVPYHSNKKYYYNESISKDWDSGNNKYFYKDKAISDFLKKDKYKNEKIQLGYIAINKLKNISIDIEDSFNEITKIIKPIFKKEIYKEKIKDLKSYKNAILKNYKILKKHIEGKKSKNDLIFTKKIKDVAMENV